MNYDLTSLVGTILVVDDDEQFRKEISEYLSENGLSVIGVPTAVHACKFIQSQPWNWYPSMIITDIVMDGMGGYEFIRRIEDMYPKRYIPIIVVSKLNAKIDIIEAESAGASGYVTKPTQPEKILKAISQVTENKKKKKYLFVSETSLSA